MNKKEALDLISKTIKKFEYIRQYRKVKYLDGDYHAAYGNMILLLKNFFSNEEMNKAMKGLNAGTDSILNSNDSVSSFAEHCSYCMAQLKICETKVRHFGFDLNSQSGGKQDMSLLDYADSSKSDSSEKPICERLMQQIEKGRKILLKPEIKPGIVKLWIVPVKTQLKKLFGADSPPVIECESIMSHSDLEPKQSLVSQLDILERLALNLNMLWDMSRQPKIQNDVINKIFLGHGRNPVWSRILTFIKDELGFSVEAFESESRVSSHIIEILSKFLNECDAAVIVLAGDDYTSTGNVRARQNVIHEIGLFQGRYGFDRVILFQEATIEEFSNVSGLQTVRYSSSPEEGFYELQRALMKFRPG